MDSDATEFAYRVWGADNTVYGPVELPALVQWVKEERVTAATWIFSDKEDRWQKAPQWPELKMFFPSRPASAPAVAASDSAPTINLKPGSLRRVKIFAGFGDDQLERFIHFMETQPIKQWTEIVKQGHHGDSMYLVLEGELRVRLMIGGKETILATLGVGEFFGEISLFDQGPRSADVVANQDSLLLKISVASFEKVTREAPDLATPFLLAIGKTLTSRIRADNKRYRDSIAFARGAGR